MNPILKKRIYEAANEFDKESSRVIFENGANFILNNLWISVEEGLPNVEGHEFSERFFVKTKDNEFKVMRVFKNTAWCDIYECQAFIPFESNIVTHWMPIPSLEGGEK